MKKSIILGSFLGLSLASFSQKINEYPVAPKDTTTNVYHEDTIADPYQWMENANDPQLALWLSQEEAITNKVSHKQTRKRELKAQLISMYHDVQSDRTRSFKKRDREFRDEYEFDLKLVSYKRSGNLLYKHRDQLSFKQLMRAKDYLQNPHDHLSYTDQIVGEENDLAVITTSINGSDWNTGYIFDLKEGEQLPFIIKNLSGSNIFWHDNTIYYDAFDSPQIGRELLDKATGQKLYKFEVGKDSLPQVVFVNPDQSGTNNFSFIILEDQLFIKHFIESQNTLYKAISCADLNAPSFFPRNFLIYPNKQETSLDVVHYHQDSVWLTTNWNAPNGKVLLANTNQANQLSQFVPQYDMVLKSVSQLGKNKLAMVYSKDGQNIALIYNYQGELLRKIDFPKGKRLGRFYEEEDVEHTSFSISSYFHPDLWYQIDLNSLKFDQIIELTLPYDVHNLETRYVTFPSKDGTEIPMYITCRKDIKLDGDNPLLLYGYGGYGSTVVPNFDESIGLFLYHGGILAVPNVRGGGAKGSDWAKEGRRLKKQNAIDDFISAADFLIKEKYTSSEKLAAHGASHGALLVTAAMIQRPELFKAVIADAGPYDMLRLNKFTAGGINTNILEFGVPNNEEDYQNLKSYSPLHNIKENEKYPNLLLMTGSNDDRVPPHHSYKFLATLQEKADPSSLFTLYVTKGAGHGGALTQEDFEEQLLFEYYFLFDNLKVDFY